VLRSAFGQTVERIKKQDNLELELAEEVFRRVILVCSRLVRYGILEIGNALRYGLTVDVENNVLSMTDGKV
jgi:hypothetical protein